MGVGAGLSMYVVVVQKFTFAISSPDEFLLSICSQHSEYHLVTAEPPFTVKMIDCVDQTGSGKGEEFSRGQFSVTPALRNTPHVGRWRRVTE